MSAKRTTYDLTITMILSVVVLGIFYGPILVDPGAFAFITTGDGLKNYFTFAYFVEHNHSFHNTSMNFPYGEFAAYTDNHPILAELYAFVHRHIFDLTNHTVAIVNLHTIISTMLTCIVFLFIFKHYKIEGTWAIIGSMFISFLSPQLLRMLGHYSLSHSYFFPLVWLLILKIQHAKHKYILCILFVISLFFMGLIHAYHLFIALMFAGFYMVFNWMSEKKTSSATTYYAIGLFTSALLFLAFTFYFDQIEDRPKYPFGIDYYTSSLKGTLLPYTGILADWLSGTLHIKNDKYESNGYLGIVTILILMTALIQWVKHIIKTRKLTYDQSTIPRSLVISLLSAFAVWLFGTNIINEISGDLLYKILPPLRQFRGLGRLSWVFYYVGSFFAIFLLYHYVHRRRRKYDVLLLAIIASMWIAEIIFLHTSIAPKIKNPNALLHSENNPYYTALIDAGENLENYQAVLSLPFCHIGNEKIAILRGEYTLSRGMGISYCSGLPMINSMMSRTSISQAMSQLQLVQGLSLYKERIEDFTDQDILIVAGSEKYTENELDLLRRSIFISEYQDVKFYRLPISALYQKQQYNFETDSTLTRHIISNQELFVNHVQDSFLDLNTYDSNINAEYFMGSGSQTYSSEDDNIFFSYRVPKGKKTDQILASFWIYIDYKQADMPQFIHRVLGQNGKVIFEKQSKYYKDPIPFKSWIHHEVIMEPGNESRTYQLVLSDGNIRIDELLVRSKGNDVYRKTNGFILKNNIPIGKIE